MDLKRPTIAPRGLAGEEGFKDASVSALSASSGVSSGVSASAAAAVTSAGEGSSRLRAR